MAGRIDGVEIRNGRNFRILNSLADIFGTVTGIRGICGSDVHIASDVGKAGMLLPEFSDADTLRRSIRKAQPYGSGLSLPDSVKLLKRVF